MIVGRGIDAAVGLIVGSTEGRGVGVTVGLLVGRGVGAVVRGLRVHHGLDREKIELPPFLVPPS